MNTQLLENIWSRMATAIKPHIGTRPLDEVAVMVRDDGDAMELITDFVCNQQGVFFNMSRDRARAETYEALSEYDVTYRFLQPHGAAFRVELMTIDSGMSPAHLAAQATLCDDDEEWVVMHVSYKAAIPGEEGYRAECHLLQNSGFHFVQECRSTYGIFSYWSHPDLPQDVYLKPRVNLRDFAQQSGQKTESAPVSGQATASASSTDQAVRMADGWPMVGDQ